LVSTPHQGEIWWAQADDKRRPVLIVTRNEAIPVLRRLVVAPVTRTIRGIPTEVSLGRDEGLGVSCAASFDDLQPVNRQNLTERVGALPASRSGEVCRALEALADC
jgi:mRNA interferase MazF